MSSGPYVIVRIVDEKYELLVTTRMFGPLGGNEPRGRNADRDVAIFASHDDAWAAAHGLEGRFGIVTHDVRHVDLATMNVESYNHNTNSNKVIASGVPLGDAMMAVSAAMTDAAIKGDYVTVSWSLTSGHQWKETT